MRLSSFKWVFAGLGSSFALLAGSLAVGACGGDSSGAAAKSPTGAHPTAIEHEPCNESGNKVVEMPGIRYVYGSGGKEICRVADINQNKKPDIYQYFDKDGQIRRREADYDEDGVVEAIEIYEGGKLAQRHLDVAGQHRLDTWDTYDPGSGRRIRRERDNDGDGRVDQWWTWDADKVTIAFDKNNDGQPDPNDTITLNASGAAILTSSTVDAGVDSGPPLSTASTMGTGIDAGLAQTVSKAPEPPLLATDGGAKVNSGALKDAGASKSGGKKP
jgi:hypothetical protein